MTAVTWDRSSRCADPAIPRQRAPLKCPSPSCAFAYSAVLGRRTARCRSSPGPRALRGLPPMLVLESVFVCWQWRSDSGPAEAGRADLVGLRLARDVSPVSGGLGFFLPCFSLFLLVPHLAPRNTA